MCCLHVDEKGADADHFINIIKSFSGWYCMQRCLSIAFGKFCDKCEKNLFTRALFLIPLLSPYEESNS